MKKVWILEKFNSDTCAWDYCFGSNNYYTFCGKSIKMLRETDKKAMEVFKESLGEVDGFSFEVRAKYKKAHDRVRDLFRVVNAEIEDDQKMTENTPYKIIDENRGVYKYIWSTK